MSNNLNWSEHIEKLENELSYRLYTLRKLEQVIPRSQLKTVADGIFNSILRYALGIFCPIRTKEEDPHPTSIHGIKVQFNDVLRLLCQTNRQQHTSIQTMLEKVGWLSINQLACEVRLVETWKAINGKDYCLKDIFERTDSKEGLRSANNVRLKTNFRSRLRETSFHFPSVELWNAAPPEVTEAKSEAKARVEIRKHVKQTIPI